MEEGNNISLRFDLSDQEIRKILSEIPGLDYHVWKNNRRQYGKRLGSYIRNKVLNNNYKPIDPEVYIKLGVLTEKIRILERKHSSSEHEIHYSNIRKFILEVKTLLTNSDRDEN